MDTQGVTHWLSVLSGVRLVVGDGALTLAESWLTAVTMKQRRGGGLSERGGGQPGYPRGRQ